MGITAYDSSQLELISTDYQSSLDNIDEPRENDTNSYDRIYLHAQSILDELKAASGRNHTTVNLANDIKGLSSIPKDDNVNAQAKLEKKAGSQLLKLSCTGMKELQKNFNKGLATKRQKKVHLSSKVYPMRKRTDIALHPFTKFQWTKLEDVPLTKRSRIDTSVLHEPIEPNKRYQNLHKKNPKSNPNHFSYNSSASSQDFDLLHGLSPESSTDNTDTDNISFSKKGNGGNSIGSYSTLKKRNNVIVDIPQNKIFDTKKTGLIDKKLDEWVQSINKDLSSSDYFDENYSLSSLSTPKRTISNDVQNTFDKSLKKADVEISKKTTKTSIASTNTSGSSVSNIQKKNRSLKVVRSATSVSQVSEQSELVQKRRKTMKKKRLTVNSIRGVLPASFLRKLDRDENQIGNRFQSIKKTSNQAKSKFKPNFNHANYAQILSDTGSDPSRNTSRNMYRKGSDRLLIDSAKKPNAYRIKAQALKARDNKGGNLSFNFNTDSTRYIGQITFNEMYAWQYHEAHQKEDIPLFMRIANREINRKHELYAKTTLVYDDPDIKSFLFDDDPIFSNLELLSNFRKSKRKAMPLKKCYIISSEKSNDYGTEVLEVWKTRMLDVRRICFSKNKKSSKSTLSYTSLYSESSVASIHTESSQNKRKSIANSYRQRSFKTQSPKTNSHNLDKRSFSYADGITKTVARRNKKNYLFNSKVRAPVSVNYSRRQLKKTPKKQQKLNWKAKDKPNYDYPTSYIAHGNVPLLYPRQSHQDSLDWVVTKITKKTNRQAQIDSKLIETQSQPSKYNFKISEIYSSLSLFNPGIYLKGSFLLQSDEPISFISFLAALSYCDSIELLEALFPIFKSYHHSQNTISNLAEIKSSILGATEINLLYTTFKEWTYYKAYTTVDTCTLMNKLIYLLLKLTLVNTVSEEVDNQFMLALLKIVSMLDVLSVDSSFDAFEELMLFRWHLIALLSTIKCICVKFIISMFKHPSIGPLPITVAIGSSKISFEEAVTQLDYKTTTVLSNKLQDYTEFAMNRLNIYSLSQFKKQESGSGVQVDITTEFLSSIVTWFGTANGFSSLLFSENITSMFKTNQSSDIATKARLIRADYRKGAVECINSDFDILFKNYLKHVQPKFRSVSELNPLFFNLNIWALLNESMFIFERAALNHTSLLENVNPDAISIDLENKMLFLENSITKSCDILLALTQFSFNGITSQTPNSSKFYLILEQFSKIADSVLSEIVKSQSKGLQVVVYWINNFIQVIHRLVCCEYSVDIQPNSKLLVHFKKMYDRVAALEKKQNYSLMKLLNNDKLLFCCKASNVANTQWGILQTFGTLFTRWNTYIVTNMDRPSIANTFKKGFKSLISKLLPTGGYENANKLEYNRLSSDFSLLLTILIGTNDQIISPQRLTTQILGLAEKMINNISISIDYEFWKLAIAAWSILSRELFKFLDNVDHQLLDGNSDEKALLKKANTLYDSIRSSVNSWDKYLHTVYYNLTISNKKLIVENFISKLIQGAYALLDQTSGGTFNASKTRVLGSIYLFLCSNCFLSLSSGYDLWPRKSHKRSTWFLHLIITIKENLSKQGSTQVTSNNLKVTENVNSEIMNESMESLFLDFSLDLDKLDDLIKATDVAERSSKQSRRAESLQKKINTVVDKCWIPNIRSALVEQCASSERDYSMLIKRIEILAITVGDCVIDGLRSWDSFLYTYGSDSLDVIQNCFMRRLAKVIFLQFAIPKMDIDDLIRLKYEITECWFQYLVDINFQSYLANISRIIQKAIQAKDMKAKGKTTGDVFPYTLITDPFNSEYSDTLAANTNSTGKDLGGQNLSIDVAFGISKFDFKLLEATANRIRACKIEAKKHAFGGNSYGGYHENKQRAEYCDRLIGVVIRSLEEFKQAKQQTFPPNLSVSEFTKVELKINDIMKIATTS